MNAERSRPMFAMLAAMTLSIACSPAGAKEQSTNVGIWYGRGEPQDKAEAYLDHVNADGTWVSEFEICHGKVAEHHVESGTWQIDKGTQRDFGRLSDGISTDFEYDYATVSNDGQTWSYRLAATNPPHPEAIGYLFTEKRVDADFRLPGCLQIS